MDNRGGQLAERQWVAMEAKQDTCPIMLGQLASVEPQEKFHRNMEFPELERTPRDHQSPLLHLS